MKFYPSHYSIRRKNSFFSWLVEWFANLSAVGWLIFVSTIFSVTGLVSFAVFPDTISYLALNPSNILAGKYFWTLITHMFLHGSFFHLAINMFVLFSLGGLCERIIGRKRMFWFYLISGLFAGLLSVFLAGLFGFGFWVKIFGGADVFMVGASGAIFAIAGLFVMLLPRLRFMIIFLPFFSLPAYLMVPLVLILTWAASIYGGLPIGNVAHLGGFLAGIFYGLYLKNKYRQKVALLQKHFR